MMYLTFITLIILMFSYLDKYILDLNVKFNLVLRTMIVINIYLIIFTVLFKIYPLDSETFREYYVEFIFMYLQIFYLDKLYSDIK